MIALEISSRNARVQALHDRRVAPLRPRQAHSSTAAPTWAEAPGGSTGLLVRQYQGELAMTGI
jgi:hypothetical protein